MACKVRLRSPFAESMISLTLIRVRMLSPSARTLFASLSATRLSARRLVAGKERFNLSNC
eukprot:217755-Pleurochrysis_carterae.AAC.1